MAFLYVATLVPLLINVCPNIYILFYILHSSVPILIVDSIWLRSFGGPFSLNGSNSIPQLLILFIYFANLSQICFQK